MAESGGEPARIARQTYDAHVLYHGTSPASAKSIEQLGFDRSRKAGGASENAASVMSEQQLTASSRHHYLTNAADLAWDVARFVDRGRPAVVRTLGVAEFVGVDFAKYLLENAAAADPAASACGAPVQPRPADPTRAAVRKDQEFSRIGPRSR